MRTIVHLSDLHFGRIDPAITPALLRAVAELKPDLVVVSGDLTQRARVDEFEAAARFLRALPGPVLCVPGNHDVPLYDVARRWLSPLGRYRRYICRDLAPVYTDTDIIVLGVNTARAMTFKNGRINRRQSDAIVHRLLRCAPDVTRIIVTHHPFDTPHSHPGAGAQADVLGRADMAMTDFLEAGIDMILSGHLHVAGIGHTCLRYPSPGRPALLIQAGTATSTRRRGEVNSFNVIRIARPQVAVESRNWRPDRGIFAASGDEWFVKSASRWSRVDPD